MTDATCADCGASEGYVRQPLVNDPSYFRGYVIDQAAHLSFCQGCQLKFCERCQDGFRCPRCDQLLVIDHMRGPYSLLNPIFSWLRRLFKKWE